MTRLLLKESIGGMVAVGSRQTLMDLFELDMVNFDIILGMDWLHSYYASLDCQTCKVVFRFPGESVIEWEGGSLDPRERFISYLRARRLIFKGFFITWSGLKILS